jgi:hypothetical protein
VCILFMAAWWCTYRYRTNLKWRWIYYSGYFSCCLGILVFFCISVCIQAIKVSAKCWWDRFKGCFGVLNVLLLVSWQIVGNLVMCNVFLLIFCYALILKHWYRVMYFIDIHCHNSSKMTQQRWIPWRKRTTTSCMYGCVVSW